MSRNKHEIEAFKINNYKRLYDYYKMLALNMFTWENLPETMDSRYIENCLLYTSDAADDRFLV